MRITTLLKRVKALVVCWKSQDFVPSAEKNSLAAAIEERTPLWLPKTSQFDCIGRNEIGHVRGSEWRRHWINGEQPLNSAKVVDGATAHPRDHTA